RQLAVHHVQIGAADTAGFDLKAQLAGAGTGCRAIDQFERSADLSQAHGSHGNLRCYWNTTPMIQCSASGGLDRNQATVEGGMDRKSGGTGGEVGRTYPSPSAGLSVGFRRSQAGLRRS